ncbi:MAG: XkdQ/YqbQ family protein [Sporomusa sp.]
MEKTDPVTTIERGISNILDYRFMSKTRDVYRTCQISYSDPQTGQKFQYIYEPPNAPETGQLLKINEQVDSPEEGAMLARKRLREKNVKENMASMTVVGDTRLVSGVTIMVKGFNKFDGKYYIDQATHAHGSGGYTVAIEMHKTMESYLVNLSNTIVTSKKKKTRRKKSKKSKGEKKYTND